MNIKKISLLALIFIACFALNNKVIAMEQIKAKILSEMKTLDKTIFDLQKNEKIEKEQNDKKRKQQQLAEAEHNENIKKLQKEINEKKQISEETHKLSEQKSDFSNQKRNDFNACLQKREVKAKELYFWQSYTTDCSELEDEYSVASSEQSKAFNESLKASNEHVKASSKLFEASDRYRNAKTSNPSNQEDYTMRNKHFDNIMQYRAAKETLKRCMFHNNISCLNDLEERLREWNKNN